MTRHAWAVPAVATAVCVVGAAVTPSSWWGVGIAMGYVATMVLAYVVVPGRSRGSWRWGALLSAFVVTMLAGIYAFLVEPFGPDPVVAIVLAVLLATAVAAAAMS